MPKTLSWAEYYAPRYHELLARGFSHEESAQVLQNTYGPGSKWSEGLLPGISNESIKRTMRKYRAKLKKATKTGSGVLEIQQERERLARAAQMEEIEKEVFGGSSPSTKAITVPPPIGLSELPPILSRGLITEYQDGHVWSDCHIPLHNDKLMNYSLERARVDGIKALYLPGDLMDMAWASKFIGWGNAGPRETQEEFDIARRIMNAAFEVFDTIYLIPGNHDGTRFKNMSHGALGFENLMVMILGDRSVIDSGHLVIGEQRYMTLTGSKWGDWRLTHPQSARAMPLSLAQTISLKTHQNILTAHQHYLASGFDRYGKNIICDGGYMSNEHLMEYKVEVDTTYSCWSPGYVELVDGWPNLVALPGVRG